MVIPVDGAGDCGLTLRRHRRGIMAERDFIAAKLCWTRIRKSVVDAINESGADDGAS